MLPRLDEVFLYVQARGGSGCSNVQHIEGVTIDIKSYVSEYKNIYVYSIFLKTFVKIV